jgi:hypothetical protein
MNKSAVPPSNKRQPILTAANVDRTMYDKCVELDQKIERYRELSQSATDQPTIDRFKELIGELFDQKVALHTKPAGPSSTEHP